MSVIYASFAALIRTYYPDEAARIIQLREEHRDAFHKYIKRDVRSQIFDMDMALYDAFISTSKAYYGTLRELVQRVVAERNLRIHTYEPYTLGELI